MKKEIVIFCVIISCLVLLVGCVDYKTYDIQDKAKETQANTAPQADDDLEKLEKELENLEKERAKADDINASSNSSGENTLAANGSSSEANAEGTGAQSAETPAVKEVVEKVPESIIASGDSLDSLIIMVKENELLKLKVVGDDPDKDPVKYSFSRPLNATGEWKTMYGDAGEYSTSISASDGKLTTDQKLKIVVQRVNVPPIIEEVRDISVDEGDVVRFVPKVHDPNKDKLTVSVTEPLKDGTWTTDHSSAGTYTIRVKANDGELDASKTFKLVVKDVNVVPLITNLAKEIRVKEGQSVKIEPKVTDPDKEDKITLTIGDPVGNDGVWQTSYTDHGEYIVVVSATDGRGKVSEKVKVIVEDINMPPRIINVSVGH